MDRGSPDPGITVLLTRHGWSRIVAPFPEEASSGTGRKRMAAARKTATVEVETLEGGVDPAFQRAILKIAIELRKPNPRAYDEVVADTIQRMRLDGHAFRRYRSEEH